jgi:prepilin-type N-terminal cleavage/methylation domain-containing protein
MDSLTRKAFTGAKEMVPEQTGFTLVETMISIIILGCGFLALASAFSQGMILMSTSHFHQIAKEKASEAVESVTTSRDTRVITWNQIRNVSEGGIFLNGPQSLRAQGADGLVNTADDGAVETETLPGPDHVLGSGDDVVVTLDSFTREIEILDVAPNLRQIRVIITYQIGHLTRQYQLTTFISSFA